MILVTTPTGNTGQLILNRLVELGQPVRALARDPQKLDERLRARVEVVTGSLTVADDLARALDGCDTVYYCIPQSTDPTDVLGYYDQFAQAARQAIQSAGQPRIVYLSGAGKDSGIKTAGAASALFHAEDVLASTGAPMRALRCPVFFDNMLWQIPAITYTGGWGLPIPGDYKLPQVAVKDIAGAAVRWLTDATWQDRQGVGVLGPEDLSHDQIAQAVSEGMGRPVHFRQTSREEHVAILTREGLSAALAHSIADMFEAIANGLFEAEPRTPQTTTPTTIREWLAESFLPAFSQAPAH